MRTGELQFVPDVAVDSDYLSASGVVKAEISAPLFVDHALVGMINVEARATAELDASDVETMRLVAERMASALALASERERLAARAELFRRLTSFATAVNATLDPARVHQSIVDELADLLGADSVGLTVSSIAPRVVTSVDPSRAATSSTSACRSSRASASPDGPSATAPWSSTRATTRRSTRTSWPPARRRCPWPASAFPSSATTSWSAR